MVLLFSRPYDTMLLRYHFSGSLSQCSMTTHPKALPWEGSSADSAGSRGKGSMSFNQL